MTASFKRLMIILAAVFLVGLIIINFLKSSSSLDDPKDIVTDLGITNTGVVDGGSTGTTQFPSTQSNETINARDFLKDPDVIDWDGAGTYMLGAGLFDQDEAYQIFYYAPDKSLRVVLLAEPFAQIRLVAQEQLKNRLGLTEAEICAMNIRVNIPVMSSESLSGQNLGLSFCPGSVQL
mgnify:FL=1